MKFKKAVACVGVAALTVGAAVLGGCGIFGKGRPKTITENGFSIELTTKFDEKLIPSGDDIFSESMIMRYESDDILLSVSQYPRDKIIYYHVYDLTTFISFIVEDCYDSDETVYGFKSEDGTLDGCTVSMFYSTDNGYASVQSEYLFVGTEYFYELSFVTFEEDFSKAQNDIKKIVLSSKAEDGLNNVADVKEKQVEFGEIKFNLNEAFKYDEKDKYYYVGLMDCTPYFIDIDAKHLTLEGVLNQYLKKFNNDSCKAYDAKTLSGTDFIYCLGDYKDGDDNYKFMSAVYIDAEGKGYVLDFTVPDFSVADRFIADAIEYAKTVTGSIDNYHGGLTAAVKTFEDKTAGADVFGYSLTLDDTFFDYGWDNEYNEFALWSAEYNRLITITKSEKSTVSTAQTDWQLNYLKGNIRTISRKTYEGMGVGYTYQSAYGVKYYWEVAFFIQTEGGVMIVSVSLNTGYFEETPTVDSDSALDACDKLIIDAIKNIEWKFD